MVLSCVGLYLLYMLPVTVGAGPDDLFEATPFRGDAGWKVIVQTALQIRYQYMDR